MNSKLFNSDCIALLKKAPSNSIDALVTDPPAGISFMNKEWDDDKGGRDGWIKWLTEVATECYRVMKPGARGLVWAIPRTAHWTAAALENAGFEVRDVITHLFGTGFPKSLDVSKAIDKAAGKIRGRIPGGQGGVNTVFGTRKPGEAISGEAARWSGLKSGAFKQKGLSSNSEQPNGWKTGNRNEKDFGLANEGGASRELQLRI